MEYALVCGLAKREKLFSPSVRRHTATGCAFSFDLDRRRKVYPGLDVVATEYSAVYVPYPIQHQSYVFGLENAET